MQSNCASSLPLPAGRGPGGGSYSPAVSIVMAAKNYARFLPEAVGSVLAQTFGDWELVIIDDGSTDHTPAVARPFLSDPRVRYFRSDTLGQPRAKNLGIGLSRGALVAFLDADDAWEPTKLEKQLAVFTEKLEVGVVFCRRTLMDEDGRPVPAKSETQQLRGSVLPDLFTQNFVCFSSAVVRREVFSHVGAFDPQWDLAIDYDLWLRVAKFHRFDFVDEQLVRYRTGHGNLSKKLRDRVDTAMSIMHRAESRYAVGDAVPAEVIADGYASTCQTIGFVMRAAEPVTSLRWYAHALRWPARRVISLKGMIAGALAAARGRRVQGSPENATVNL
ncbi:glycosyltransferase [Gemmata sp. JC717]|uniref:glycosyltransferase family 2 protein n=1 Tax=Gemmata algarum TaxID=2975278 RepID=UPI0021BAC55B|nr:glycosyltransferase [Gemmata algarum]MDY3553536.1 glycosyltransferase [Gemmata algarum]